MSDPTLAFIYASTPSADLADVGALRASIDDGLALVNDAAISEGFGNGVKVVDRTIPGPGSGAAPEIPIRIYSPEATGRLPIVLFIHSGAFVGGGLESEHFRCLLLSERAECVVVSVAHRLAPEHPFPAPFDDCYEALLWTAANAGSLGADVARLGVVGVSSGGALAAGVCLAARDRGGPAITLQSLVVPVLDDRLDTPSMRAMGTGSPGWNAGAAAQMWDMYVGDDRRDTSPYAAPARAMDLAGLPPTFISTAEFDCLRDEGLQYAMRLIAAGVPTDIQHFAGGFHGFDMMFAISSTARRAFFAHIDAAREALHQPTSVDLSAPV